MAGDREGAIAVIVDHLVDRDGVRGRDDPRVDREPAGRLPAVAQRVGGLRREDALVTRRQGRGERPGAVLVHGRGAEIGRAFVDLDRGQPDVAAVLRHGAGHQTFAVPQR